MSELENISINEKGIYKTKYEYLSPLQVVGLRKRLQTRIVNLRTEIEDRKLQIVQKEQQVQQKEKELKELASPIVQSYIEQWQQKTKDANEKAEKLLLEVLGKETYTLLKKTKSLVFNANGMDYKITENGKLFRKTNNEWRELCIIRPRYLPLPDFVLSLLFNVRKQQYPFKRR
jgi:hypothetical protein